MSGIVHLFNGLKGFMVVSGQRSGGFTGDPASLARNNIYR